MTCCSKSRSTKGIFAARLRYRFQLQPIAWIQNKGTWRHKYLNKHINARNYPSVQFVWSIIYFPQYVYLHEYLYEEQVCKKLPISSTSPTSIHNVQNCQSFLIFTSLCWYKKPSFSWNIFTRVSYHLSILTFYKVGNSSP